MKQSSKSATVFTPLRHSLHGLKIAAILREKLRARVARERRYADAIFALPGHRGMH
ncbi:TPA: hypothetical protein KCN18_004152 [Escherichia coli]|nr:hypothetical protein [Escherichia coli]HBB7752695.1 hypothetical protein [Escherichia coli]HBB7832149.1 hypothetical protein [Escherichia coli]HBB7860091.1 hypothetical protein [Escherichia coli]